MLQLFVRHMAVFRYADPRRIQEELTENPIKLQERRMDKCGNNQQMIQVWR